jgi:hypothetical protein
MIFIETEFKCAGEFATSENIYNGAISQNPAHLNSVSINIIKNCNVLD